MVLLTVPWREGFQLLYAATMKCCCDHALPGLSRMWERPLRAGARLALDFVSEFVIAGRARVAPSVAVHLLAHLAATSAPAPSHQQPHEPDLAADNPRSHRQQHERDPEAGAAEPDQAAEQDSP